MHFSAFTVDLKDGPEGRPAGLRTLLNEPFLFGGMFVVGHGRY